MGGAGNPHEAGVGQQARRVLGHRDRHVDILLAVDQQHGDPQPRQLGVDVQVPYVGDVTTPEGDVTAIDAVREGPRHGRARAEAGAHGGRQAQRRVPQDEGADLRRPPDRRQGRDEPTLAPSEQGRPADVDEGPCPRRVQHRLQVGDLGEHRHGGHGPGGGRPASAERGGDGDRPGRREPLRDAGHAQPRLPQAMAADHQWRAPPPGGVTGHVDQ